VMETHREHRMNHSQQTSIDVQKSAKSWLGRTGRSSPFLPESVNALAVTSNETKEPHHGVDQRQ
jgi:hypothetical protein